MLRPLQLLAFSLLGAMLMDASALAASPDFAPLPTPPAGFHFRQVAAMSTPPVRITSDGSGRFILVLTLEGDVYQIDLPDAAPRKLIDHAAYTKSDNQQCIGLTLDRQRRLYVVVNAFDFTLTPAMNHVTIYRSAPITDGIPPQMTPWFSTDIPFAIDVFQHGVSFIAQGPDGLVYVSSGSRTDHGEAGNDPKRSKEGETPVTSSIWRLDPANEHPKIEIFARGLRNAFGFCFDRDGKLWATENGPNADPPEEMNLIEQGKHYGFPFEFADWKNKAYPDQPDAPAGLKMERPFAMFDAHSSPSGIVQLGDDFPRAYRGTFLVARFGNLIGPRDVGFDIVQVTPFARPDGRMVGQVRPFVAPIARPTDLHHCGKGKIYVAELWRQIRNDGKESPGRILEISADE